MVGGQSILPQVEYVGYRRRRDIWALEFSAAPPTLHGGTLQDYEPEL